MLTFQTSLALLLKVKSATYARRNEMVGQALLPLDKITGQKTDNISANTITAASSPLYEIEFLVYLIKEERGWLRTKKEITGPFSKIANMPFIPYAGIDIVFMVGTDRCRASYRGVVNKLIWRDSNFIYAIGAHVTIKPEREFDQVVKDFLSDASWKEPREFEFI